MPLNETERNVLGRLTQITLNIRTEVVGTGDNWTGACIFQGAGGNAEILKGSAFRSGQDQSSVEQWVKDATKDWPKSRKDSEAKALADLAFAHDEKLISGNWNFALYSSNGPCKSCKSVISAFKKYYKEISGNNNFYGLIIYINANHKVPPSNIWPNGCLYGYGNEDTDTNGMFYKRI